jgi:hypothetical protein
MSPATAALLRAVADLASYAQGHPTDSAGIRGRAQARSRAEAAWVQAGSPDLSGETPRPAVMPAGVGRVEEEKDWTPTSMVVEVKRVTERALLLDAGDGEFWCPRSLVRADEDIDAGGDIGAVTVPRWVLP